MAVLALRFGRLSAAEKEKKTSEKYKLPEHHGKKLRHTKKHRHTRGRRHAPLPDELG
jgi:hypothetical protein